MHTDALWCCVYCSDIFLALGKQFWLVSRVYKTLTSPCILPIIKTVSDNFTYITDILNTLRPRQNGRHFADDTFKRIFMNENVRISIKISLKFVPKGPIN